MAAISSAYAMPTNRRVLYELRGLRSFDPRWFDQAYVLVFTLIVAHLMQSNPTLLEP